MTWYLHLPCLGALLLALSCLQQPHSMFSSGKKIPQRALMKAGILSCLKLSLYRFCSVSNGTLFLTEETNGGSVKML